VLDSLSPSAAGHSFPLVLSFNLRYVLAWLVTGKRRNSSLALDTALDFLYEALKQRRRKQIDWVIFQLIGSPLTSAAHR
jgi:hypothetical protein